MLKRDLISAELEKLNQVLTRIIGLKKELQLDEATHLFNETLLSGFDLDSDLLINPNISVFEDWINHSKLDAAQLNLLSDFLYSDLDFENEPIKSKLFAEKLTVVYQCLRDKFQIVHLINLGRQRLLENYL